MGKNGNSTLGMLLKYAVEAEAGKRPVSGYITIPGVKDMPDMNPKPGTIDVTDLSDTEYKRYEKGLKDLGGALAFLMNDTADNRAAVEACITAYKAAAAEGKEMWFEIFHPNLAKSTFFTGEPSDIGFGGAKLESALETNLYITPHNAPARFEKSTATGA